eukprot:TRINITY_DN17234_c0_g1_i1.p1 TRINITY_DN17234_c0_g1~~TRINITY_DN17234_c0_g1_i1.p1  ORF type:complete len:607 (+),score=111.08 TRINITY_DN17234_c0_g1_i1:191-2011(+)
MSDVSKPLTITDDGEWAPNNGEHQRYMYRVQYAPTGRARCRQCSEMIPAKSVRFGKPIAWRGGAYGYISTWAHTTCVRVEESEEDVRELLHGLTDLSPEDQREVMDEITKTEIPEHMKAIDPEDDSLFASQDPPVPRKPPRGLTQRLLPFQEEGLGWMCKQELSGVRGGILSDEMGMGKTIQSISLIVASKRDAEDGEGVFKPAPVAAETEDDCHPTCDEDEPPVPPKHGPTLVICPVSAMMQWADEIAAHTDGCLKVAVYYGDRKHNTAESLAACDVVLTSYAVVENEYRAIVDKMKVACKYCGKKLLPRTLVVHQQYFCGPDAELSEKLRKREKKHKDAAEKAMVTLKIRNKRDSQADTSQSRAKKKPPTMANVYKELMEEANRKPLGLFEKPDETNSDVVSKEDIMCARCKSGEERDSDSILLCDGCNKGFHQQCCQPVLASIPEGAWYCEGCSSSPEQANQVPAHKRTRTRSRQPPPPQRAVKPKQRPNPNPNRKLSPKPTAKPRARCKATARKNLPKKKKLLEVSDGSEYEPGSESDVESEDESDEDDDFEPVHKKRSPAHPLARGCSQTRRPRRKGLRGRPSQRRVHGRCRWMRTCWGNQ